MADPLDFGVDLSTVVERVEALQYFATVADIIAATEALDADVPASAPAAFVAISDERARPNRYTGGHDQEVDCDLTILFVESSARFARDTKDVVDTTKRALIRQFIGWQPDGAGVPLDYVRFRVVQIGNGFVWAEVVFTTRYRVGTTA